MNEIDVTKPELYQFRDVPECSIKCMFRNPDGTIHVVYITSNHGHMSYTVLANGRWNEHVQNKSDIILKPGKKPWSDLKDGDPCMVSSNGTIWKRRYYAREIDGSPYAYVIGCTKWSAPGESINECNFCRPPTPEELGE